MKKYAIGQDPARLPAELITSFAGIEIATIGHFRHRGFVHNAIRPLGRIDGTMAGTAITVAIPGTDSTMLHHAISAIRPGDVLVIDRLGDDRHACLGGGVAFAAKTAGALAVLLDGPCTDAEEIAEVGLPVFCRGISAITSRLDDLGGALNLPVAVGGVPVLPGDLVLLDNSGALVLPADEAEDVLIEGQARQARANRNRGRIASGEMLGDLSGASAKVHAILSDST
ncbi:regulator of RNase E activity RraA [Palleronia aestuarii]|uniref:Putative 4-hydroxy-4-methyl-2-oxoglutarate aldolase n=1 Tax=Palleronia aestuarii TaxID=568105 RepID=A0A2W7N454_9RHOB|nr:RraA family protein [Palleronia aestuarii]PZX14870.1 regulator of RNase E activity RraA [Palleronia aestuarii]